MVGGAREAHYSIANTYKIILKNRKGFIRVVLKTGAYLVPAISFGENNMNMNMSQVREFRFFKMHSNDTQTLHRFISKVVSNGFKV